MRYSIRLDTITQKIQSEFQDSPPNGWNLGWKTDRFYESIQAAAFPHLTINHTSFDYGFCNWFEVCPKGNMPKWTLTVKVSFIVPVYSVHWTEYADKANGLVRPFPPVNLQSVEDKIRVTLEEKFLSELPTEWYDIEINGITLELSGNRNVTLSKCLFSDHSN